MDQKILVCYASGTGSTGEVAAVIGEELAGDVNLSDADLEGAHYNYQTK